MVKGVNKNVIEINDTGSEIFERVVFYISPKYSSLSPKKLLKETERMTLCYEKRTGKAYLSLRRRMRIKRRLIVCGLVLGSAAIVGGILWLIF